MKSNRLKTIASLIDKNSSVIDIGTDHGYLPIFLVEDGITTQVMATDVSANALNAARKNIMNAGLENIIRTQVTDGFQGIDTFYDVGVLAGMGTETMKKILQSNCLPKILILQSNNDLDVLRLFMNQLGWKIEQEVAVFDHGKYYVVMKYVVGQEILSEKEILFGKSENVEYLSYLLDKYNTLYNRSKQAKFLKNVQILEEIIEKIQA